MPNKQITDGNYRYNFQGQEKDPETGMEAFELRLWDGRLGRWLTVDPMGQYNSPYLGMGNNPVSHIDPNGGWDGDPPTNGGGCSNGDTWNDGKNSWTMSNGNWINDNMNGMNFLAEVAITATSHRKPSYFELNFKMSTFSESWSRINKPKEISSTPWMDVAKSQVGVKELTGNNDGEQVEKYLKSCGISKGNPWCAAFVNWSVEEAGISGVSNNPAYSLNWNTWGDELSEPAYGAIATMRRTGGGHIGFVAGKTASGRIVLLGGNQSDQVKYESFKATKILHYRFPSGQTPNYNLPTISASNNSKVN